ncbi:MAG: zinc ribbon domain-containing protein [Clostridia bacterium]|nr:zinc ribbon domain-containing protein [Clostridia bacterium]
MGAMIIGMITGTVAMFLLFVEMVVCGVVLALIAHKLKMNAFWWGIAGFLLNVYAVVVFVITAIKIRTKKCPECKIKVKPGESICPSCGKEIKIIDDKKIAKSFLKIVATVMAVGSIMGGIWVSISTYFEANDLPWQVLLFYSAILGAVGCFLSRKRNNKCKWAFTLLGIAIPWVELAVFELLDYVINTLGTMGYI